jgi:hypothetical protein
LQKAIARGVHFRPVESDEPYLATAAHYQYIWKEKVDRIKEEKRLGAEHLTVIASVSVLSELSSEA